MGITSELPRYLHEGELAIKVGKILKDYRFQGVGDVYIECKLIDAPPIPAWEEHVGKFARATISRVNSGRWILVDCHV